MWWLGRFCKAREWLACLKDGSWCTGLEFSLLALKMVAGAASEAKEEHSDGWRERVTLPVWMGNTRLGGGQGCGHPWLMQFLLSIPGSKENKA